jgi:hypothetical protein
VIPWHGRTLVGTTDKEVKEAELEPRASDEDIGFILRNAGRYLAREPKWAGTGLWPEGAAPAEELRRLLGTFSTARYARIVELAAGARSE